MMALVIAGCSIVQRVATCAGERPISSATSNKVTKISSDSKGAAVAVHTGKAFWGMFSEFGTSRQPARPWLSPALDASAVAALGRLGKNLGDRLERTAKELAGRYNALKKSTKRRL